jgi:alanine-glyoxylate transaminase/serine-glyoxylate transaminase/serine-pyruvate transaminase
MPGFNHLYIPGPTNMPERLRRACDRGLQDMRAPDFPEFVRPLLDDLKRVFRTETGQVFVFPGSGTGGWEAAVSNTLSPGDKVLTAVFGQFSMLWADLCRRHGLEVEVIERPWGEGAPVETIAECLQADAEGEIKAVLVCHNETATGVTSDVAGVRKALDEAGHPALLFVDGVSSIASLDFQMDAWGVDVAVAGSQKGFMLPTGLAIVAASQKALAARQTARLARCYFDFEDQIRFNDQGFFPYTPATTLLYGLRESVDMLLEEGLDQVARRHRYIAEGVRRAVHAWGLALCARDPKWYSDTVSAIMVPEQVDSGEIVRHAYHRYNLSLGGGLTKVKGRVFRIGHLGDTNELMLLTAIAGSELAMRDCGIDVVPGSGVAAAQEYYRGADQSARVAAE